MNTVALILALFVALASCYSEQEYQNAFTAWMQGNKKSYTAADFQVRFSTFKKNMDYVSAWNAQNAETKRMSLFSSLRTVLPSFSFSNLSLCSYGCYQFCQLTN